MSAWQTHQKHDRDVEHKGAGAVEEEGEQADVVDLGHRAPGDFPGERHHAVHEGAYGSEVVQRDKGVHLELGRAQEALHHGQAESLKGDACDLVDDTNPDKLDLAERGNDDTDDDDRDVQEDPEVWLGDTQSPAGEKNSDGSGGLPRRQYDTGWRMAQLN